jgi:hypothetical protein
MKGFFFGGIDVYILILVSINVNTNCWIFHGLLKIHFDVILRKRSAWHRPQVRSVPAASLAPAFDEHAVLVSGVGGQVYATDTCTGV